MLGMHIQSAVSGTQGRVLVVEDEELVRKTVTLVLRTGGYEVVEAEDGDQAIKALNSDDNPLMVDAILCDIRMPRMDGTEAIPYFRAQYPGVPVVVLTGYPDTELAVSLLKQGVLDYLVKPTSKDQLLSAVSSASNRHEIFKDQFAV